MSGGETRPGHRLMAFAKMRLRTVEKRFGFYLLGLIPMAMIFDARLTALGLFLISALEVMERQVIRHMIRDRSVFRDPVRAERWIVYLSVYATLPVVTTTPLLWILGSPHFNVVCCAILATAAVYAALRSAGIAKARHIRVGIYGGLALALCAWDLWTYWDSLTTAHLSQPAGALIFLIGLGFLGREFESSMAARSRALAMVQQRSEEARRASAQKSRFLAVMSHEIRTPLHGMMGMAQLIDRTPLNPDQRKKLRILLESGASLAALLDGAMDLAAAEEGGLRTEPVPCDPAVLCRSAASGFSAPTRQRDLEIRIEVARNVPRRLMLDATRLRQCLSHLLSNAVKFSQSGSIDLSVVVLPGEDGERIAFRVADRGPGIPEGSVERIFQPYAQLDDGRTRAAGGAGLGLAITHRLMSAMAGTVFYEPRPGGGSVFTLALPLVAAPDPDGAGPRLSQTTEILFLGRIGPPTERNGETASVGSGAA